MCVIMYKPVGKVLKTEYIKQCFNTNRDGAGYMYAKDGSVFIKKGFMTLDALFKSLKETIAEFGGSTRNIPMVLHFRIGTQGGRRPEITHPYPVCRDYNKMKKTEYKCELAMAHNGILRYFSDALVTDHNDSMEFVKDCAADIIDGDIYFHKRQNKMRLLTRMSRGSRLIFLDKTGYVTMTGGWEEFEGYYFSHYMGFMTKVFTPVTTPKVAETYLPPKPKDDLTSELDKFFSNLPGDDQ